jgi:hypothetical protein
MREYGFSCFVPLFVNGGSIFKGNFSTVGFVKGYINRRRKARLGPL